MLLPSNFCESTVEIPGVEVIGNRHLVHSVQVESRCLAKTPPGIDVERE